ncbi:MAG: apolipoprotein N-acyltransferase [Asticcacaulis sp.]
MAPFAATLLPGGIALFWAPLPCFTVSSRPTGMKRFLFYAALFSLFEILRGTIFTGFPWNPAGATWRAGGAMSQTAACVGVYGLSFITVAIFASVAVLRREAGWKGWWPAIASAAALVLCFAAGETRLLTTKVLYSNYIVRVVQPAIGQREKWSTDAAASMFADYVSMTRAAPQRGRAPDLVVWPEGALPSPLEDLISEDSYTAPVLATMLHDKQAFIMGVTRTDEDAGGHVIWRNSMMAMHQTGTHAVIDGFYNKYKLVPFGEFTPFQMLARKIGFKPLTHFDDSFTAGEPTKAVSFGTIPRFLPLICYEGIFPGLDATNYTSSTDPCGPGGY